MSVRIPALSFRGQPSPLVCALVVAGAIAAAADRPRADSPDVGAGSHERQVARVRSAATGEYTRARAEYDDHLVASPADVTAAIEQCRFVAHFLYDEDEGLADAAREDFDRCVDSLESGRHAAEPAARLFVLDQQWGDEAVAAGEALVSASRSWPPHLRSQLHARLAFLYDWLGDETRAGSHALRAVALDPGSEAAILAANRLERLGGKARARSVLASVPEAAWDAASAQQAAALLLRLGDARRAVGLLRDHVPDGGDAARFLLAKALAADGDIAGAREAYASALAHAVVPGVEHLRTYFAFERDHGLPAEAAAAFIRLRDHGYWADPFGRYRSGLVFRQPLAPWTLLDAAGMLALLAVIAGLALAPLLVIVPVHYYSLVRRSRATVAPPAPAAGVPWGLGHAWYALAVLLVGGTVGLYLFAYADFEAALAMAPFYAVPGEDRALGRAFLFGTMLTVALALPLLRGVKWLPLIQGHWPLWRSLWAATFLVIAVRLLGSLFASPGGAGALGSDTTRAMQGIHAEYGVLVLILFAAVIVPVVEEILFRGVLLNALARHLWFPVAAVIQALVFAGLHEGSPHIPLIFGVGLATAWLYRRSGGLIAPIALHVFNNALACFAIVRATGALDAWAAP